MSDAALQQHRRQRLADLLAHEQFAGNKAELGRAMGYRSGAFVRQLLAGERPITEKTVAVIETMHGAKFKGWFAAPQASNEPGTRMWWRKQTADFADPAHLEVVRGVMHDTQLAHFLIDFAMLTQRRQSELIDLVHQEAEHAREIIAQHEARTRPVPTKETGAKTPTAAAQRPKRARATVAIRRGDGNPRQGALPLVTTADPFTAEPDEREREWYDRIARDSHPK